MPSLLNMILADKVSALVDEAGTSYGPEQTRAISRENALGIIHCALWGHSSRDDGTAGAYAWMELMHLLGIKRWSFKEDWSDNYPRPSPEIAQGDNPTGADLSQSNKAE